MIHDLVQVLSPCLLVLAVAAFFIGRAVLRQGRRSAIRMEHHLERRLVDAILAAGAYVLFRRWRDRHPRSRPPAIEGDDIYRACTLTPWTGNPNTCRWCDQPLPDRSRRFCRPQCARAAHENHVFGGAGGARDTALARDGYRCQRCGAGATHEHALEVNHITPCLGRHGVAGCWHHLAGLETLCRRHHLQVTAGQRRNGDFDRPRRWVS